MTDPFPAAIFTRSLGTQNALAVGKRHHRKQRKPTGHELVRYERQRASDGDVPTSIDPDLRISNAAGSHQAAVISQQTLATLAGWLWGAFGRKLGFWRFAKVVLGAALTFTFILASIPILVPTNYSLSIARFADPVSAAFCSVPINHYLCAIICVTPQSPDLYISVCGETSTPQDLSQIMIDVSDQLASSVKSSTYLHPLPRQIRSLRDSVERMSGRFRRQQEKTSFKIPDSDAVLELLEKFISVSQSLPVNFKKYLLELETAVDVFMYHNDKTLQDFRTGVLRRQEGRFPILVYLLGAAAGQHISKALELSLGPSQDEEQLKRRIDNHLNVASSCLKELHKMGEKRLGEVNELLSISRGLRNLLDSAKLSIQQERQKRYNSLDVKVRFVIEYLKSSNSDNFGPIIQGLELVMASEDYFVGDIGQSLTCYSNADFAICYRKK